MKITREQALDQLVDIEEFAKDLRVFLSAEETVVAPAKTEKKVKVEAPVTPIEEDEIAEVSEDIQAKNEIIMEYGLADMEVADLKEYLNSYEIEFNKQAKKKDYFIDLVAQAILDGTIPTEEEEGEAEAPEAPEAPEEEAEEEETEPISVRNLAETSIAEKLVKEFEAKKLKESTIKAYLKAHYNGEPDCKDCREGCTKEEMLKCYIELKQNLVDDEGEVHKESEAYYRDGNIYCCGEEVKMLENGNAYCEVCGEEYALTEE